MDTKRGVLYISVGDPSYRRMLRESIASLRRSGYGGEIAVVVDMSAQARLAFGRTLGAKVQIIAVQPATGISATRALKTTLNRLSPFDETLYLDCDTLFLWPPDQIWKHLRDVSAAFAIDMHTTIGEALDAAPSENRGSTEELRFTRSVCAPTSPYFNAGVCLWRRSAAADAFFDAWHEEWKRFSGIDQFALARTLATNRYSIGQLPPRFNSPSVKAFDLYDATRNRVCILHFCPTAQQSRFADFALQRKFDVNPLIGLHGSATMPAFRGTHFG